MKALHWTYFCTSAAAAALFVYLVRRPAFAFEQAQPAAATAPAGELEELVVTGSRIRRVETTTAEPVGVVSAENIEQRGFTNAAQALNKLPQVRGSSGVKSGTISRGAASGREFINLFNLGTQRTLTLVNGRRFVSSNPAGGGGGGNQVDMNNIPLGLVDRIRAVQSGRRGDLRLGRHRRGGQCHPQARFRGRKLLRPDRTWPTRATTWHLVRGTFGRNFLDGRANVALNVEWAKSRRLLPTDRRSPTSATAAPSTPTTGRTPTAFRPGS